MEFEKLIKLIRLSFDADKKCELAMEYLKNNDQDFLHLVEENDHSSVYKVNAETTIIILTIMNHLKEEHPMYEKFRSMEKFMIKNMIEYFKLYLLLNGETNFQMGFSVIENIPEFVEYDVKDRIVLGYLDEAIGDKEFNNNNEILEYVKEKDYFLFNYLSKNKYLLPFKNDNKNKVIQFKKKVD